MEKYEQKMYVGNCVFVRITKPNFFEENLEHLYKGQEEEFS